MFSGFFLCPNRYRRNGNFFTNDSCARPCFLRGVALEQSIPIRSSERSSSREAPLSDEAGTSDAANRTRKVNAINDARRNGIGDFTDATLYVTLEPCCHTGRTPPCCDLVIETGIRRVVAGMRDPDPRVSGKGFAALRAAGVETVEPILEAECREINRIFIKYTATGTPFVLLKMAMTLDGKTVPDNDAEGRQWISSFTSRTETHRIRSEMTAVMCGIGTVLADDPELSVRHVAGRNPVRIIVDSNFRTPSESKIVSGAHDQRTIIAGLVPAGGPGGDTTKNRIAALEKAGVEILAATPKNEIETAQPSEVQSARIDLDDLARKLGRIGIDSILLEGGATLAASAVAEGIVDRMLFHIAPAFGGERLQNLCIYDSGGDVAVEGSINACSGGSHVHGNY